MQRILNDLNDDQQAYVCLLALLRNIPADEVDGLIDLAVELGKGSEESVNSK